MFKPKLLIGSLLNRLVYRYVTKQGYEYAADDMDLIYRDAGTYGDSIGVISTHYWFLAMTL